MTYPKISKEGWPFILPSIVFVAVGVIVHSYLLASIFAVFLLLFLFFFRDPDRSAPDTDGAVLAPADGRVIEVGELEEGTASRKISIFLSLFDVHVTRAPVSGRIASVKERRGSHHAAFAPEASVKNAGTELEIETVNGKIRIVQIAGLVARRSVVRKEPGEETKKGERIGIIKFGSRVDLFLPPEVEFTVEKGDRVRGGETVLALIKGKEKGERSPGDDDGR